MDSLPLPRNKRSNGPPPCRERVSPGRSKNKLIRKEFEVRVYNFRCELRGKTPVRPTPGHPRGRTRCASVPPDLLLEDGRTTTTTPRDSPVNTSGSRTNYPRSDPPSQRVKSSTPSCGCLEVVERVECSVRSRSFPGYVEGSNSVTVGESVVCRGALFLLQKKTWERTDIYPENNFRDGTFCTFCGWDTGLKNVKEKEGEGMRQGRSP